MTLKVTVEDVANAVNSSDAVKADLSLETISHVTEIALVKLSLTAVIYERLLLELPSGMKLEIKPCK